MTATDNTEIYPHCLQMWNITAHITACSIGSVNFAEIFNLFYRCSLLPSLSSFLWRSVVLSREIGSSSWLTALMLSDFSFPLHKGAFRDALYLRNGWRPSLLSNQLCCICTCIVCCNFMYPGIEERLCWMLKVKPIYHSIKLCLWKEVNCWAFSTYVYLIRKIIRIST